MDLDLVDLGGAPDAPLLVLGPSLGTGVEQLWSRVTPLVEDRFRIVGWDLPGHAAAPDSAAPFSCGDVARAIADRVAEPFHYAGDSMGGAVGLHLLLDAPDLVRSAMVLATGAKIGTAEAWHDRAAFVRDTGTAAMVEGSRERWFAPGNRDDGEPLLAALPAVGGRGYAAACAALAEHDVRARLGEITQPVLAVAGAEDVPTPTAALREIADGVAAGELVELPGVAHLPPWEDAAAVAELLLRWTATREP